MGSTHPTEVSPMSGRSDGKPSSIHDLPLPPHNAVLVLSTQGFAVLHNSYRWTTFFQVHFIVGAMINLARCIYVSREKGVGPARGLLKRSMIATVLAGSCWMVSAACLCTDFGGRTTNAQARVEACWVSNCPSIVALFVCVRWHGKLSDPLADGRSRQDRAKDEASHHNAAVRQTRLLG